MKLLFNRIFPFLLLLLTGLAACTPGRMLTTRDGMRAGQQYIFRYTGNSESTMEDPNKGETILIQSREIRDESYTVLAVLPDGSIDMEIRLLRLQKSETRQGVTTHFDSELPGSDTSGLQASLYREMINFPFRMRLKPDGLVGSLSGFDSLFNKIQQARPGEPEMAPVIKGIKAQFNDETFKDQVAGIWTKYPSKRLRVGKQWKQSTRQAGFRIQQETRYQLLQMEPGSAKIQMNMIFKADPEHPDQLDFGLFTMSYSLQGAGAGLLEVDQPVALLRRLEQRYSLEGFVRIKVGFLPPQFIPMRSTMHQIIERVQ